MKIPEAPSKLHLGKMSTVQIWFSNQAAKNLKGKAMTILRNNVFVIFLTPLHGYLYIYQIYK